jgi:group I intron endonuclease
MEFFNFKENKNKAGIYNIINLINGKIYIGSTILFSNRYKHHLFLLKNNKHKNQHLQSSYNVYGKDNFKFIVVEIVNSKVVEEIRNIEQKYINEAIPNWEFVYNSLRNVSKIQGYAKDKIESNRKTSENRKKYYKSKEGQQLIRKFIKNREGKTYEELFGAERAAEIKKKISDNQRTAMSKENAKENLRQIFSGKTYEERFGVERAKEIKLKQSIGRKGKTVGDKHHKYRVINNVKLLSPDGIIYTKIEGVVAFAKKHNLKHGHLSNVLSGKRKSHRGWRLVD